MNTIKLNNVSIGYGRKVVAEGITSTLCSGKLTCLLGVNGAGKSTLLRTLSAFQPALGGTIDINGRDICEMSPKERATTISVVLTEKTDLQNMTVRELVAMGRAPYTGFWGTMEQGDCNMVDEAMTLVGITGLADRMIQTLSDGERQKTMIAKALAQHTPFIFLDEPTAFLDFPSKVEMMHLLKHLCREQDKAVIMSTHDLDIALQMADQLWLMNKDSGITIGSPHELADSGDISAFVSNPHIHFNPSDFSFCLDYE